MSHEFTIERRTFLLGAVLAPLASRFAAAGVAPRRSGTEFVVKLSRGEVQFNIFVTDSGDVDKVFYSTEDQKSPMHEVGRCGDWYTFRCDNPPHHAELRFRVNDAHEIDVHHVMAVAWLFPQKDQAILAATDGRHQVIRSTTR